MNPLSPETRLRNIYNQYLYMDDKAFYDKIRFFDQNESDILLMRLEDSLWIQSGYLDALFETGEYKKFNDKSQDFLQRLIYHNIDYFHGENPFQETLHKRASSLYHSRNYNLCVHTAQELININPSRKDTARILFFAFRRSHTGVLKFIKAGLIASMFMTAFLLVFHQIIIASFFSEMSLWFLQLIMYIAIPLISGLLMYKFSIDLRCWIKCRKWVNSAKKSKR